MVSTGTSIPFAHPILTTMAGTPTHWSIQVLQRELYTNARSVPSTRGGGNHGHLAVLMDPATYNALTGVDFAPPDHPGQNPVHGNGPTASQITEINRQFAAALAEYTLYQQVLVELKKQLIAAVDPTFLRTIEDPDFGFSELSPRELLQHLQQTYGKLTPGDLEKNRAKLSEPWNPDSPIETLWLRIQEARRVATVAHDDISEMAAINLTLMMLEQNNILPDATRHWRRMPTNIWTLPHFIAEFSAANIEHQRQATARSTGYHSAHAATQAPSTVPPPTKINNTSSQNGAPAPTVTNRSTSPVIRVNDITLFYTDTCKHRAPGHIATATITNMHGGNATFTAPRGQRPPGHHPAPHQAPPTT